MELSQVIAQRRSIRKYKDQPIEKEKIKAMLQSFRLCQSAKNRQPWRISILTKERKNLVSQIMLDMFEKNDVPLANTMNSAQSSAMIIQHAPLLFLIWKQPDPTWNIGDNLSIGAAIEHLCLTAVDLGLGALWIRDTAYTEKEIAKVMGYPELELMSAVAVGVADENPKARPRLDLAELILPDNKID